MIDFGFAEIALLITAGIALYYYIMYRTVLKDNRQIAYLCSMIAQTNAVMYDRLPEDQREDLTVISGKNAPF